MDPSKQLYVGNNKLTTLHRCIIKWLTWRCGSRNPSNYDIQQCTYTKRHYEGWMNALGRRSEGPERNATEELQDWETRARRTAPLRHTNRIASPFIAASAPPPPASTSPGKVSRQAGPEKSEWFLDWVPYLWYLCINC